MSSRQISLVVATILTGLSAGFFFTYEASVIVGLAQVDDRTYVTTFQAINDTIRNPAFGLVFFGTIPALGIAGFLNWKADGPTRWLVGVGIALYLTCLAVTAGGNVPLNEQLAETTEVTQATAAQARADFETSWNRLNRVRTVAVVASFSTPGLSARSTRCSDAIRIHMGRRCGCRIRDLTGDGLGLTQLGMGLAELSRPGWGSSSLATGLGDGLGFPDPAGVVEPGDRAWALPHPRGRAGLGQTGCTLSNGLGGGPQRSAAANCTAKPMSATPSARSIRRTSLGVERIRSRTQTANAA